MNITDHQGMFCNGKAAAFTRGIDTYSGIAAQLAAGVPDPEIAAHLRHLCALNRKIAHAKPETFEEACQFLLWYQMACRSYNGSGSLGRLDALLYPYYARETAAGTLDDERAVFLIACLLLRDTAYVHLGGYNRDGSDATNPVSYLVLEAVHRLKLPSNVGVCVGKGLDRNLLRKSVEYQFADKNGNPRFVGMETLVRGLVRNEGVSIEDARFWEHNGVDWKRTFAAVFNLMTGGSGGRFGASTIPQQVVKNVTGDDDYSMMRKIEEILRALNLRKNYSREEVLEFYLNTAYFGQNTNGVQAAAKVYFDKDVSELSLAECASIIGITQYPSRYNPFLHEDYNKERQETVLWKMYDLGWITEEEDTAAKNEELVFQKEKVQEEQGRVQSWFVDEVIKNVLNDLVEEKGYAKSYANNLIYKGGLRIYSTIDVNVQNTLDTVFEDMSSFPTLSGEEQPQASMTVLDPYTGAVLGIAGARGEKTAARLFNYATDAKRQPGSTIKPLAVYAPALEYGVATQGSVYDDAPVDVEKRYPRNYDSSYAAYRGRMDVKQAVYRSVNTVAMAVLEDLGVERAFNFITENLGVTTLVRREVIGGQVKSDVNLAPLSLGGVTHGVTNLEMAAAYSAFVNKGIYNKPYTYTKVVAYDGTVLLEHEADPVYAMSEQTAYLINDLLQGVVRSGTGTPAQLSNMAVAGKTGTAEIGSDKTREIGWFIAFVDDEEYSRLVCVTLELPANYEGTVRYDLVRELLMP